MAKRIALQWTFEERLWKRVDKNGPGGCWLWTGNKAANGYGRIQRSRKGGTVAVHRAAYELLVGPIPDDLELDHLCMVRNCVNPAHLEPVDHRTNVLRGSSPIALNVLKTHCPQGHEYTPENTKWTRASGRCCRKCKAAEQYRRRKRKQAERPVRQRDVDRHGTRSRYEGRGCRCDECRAAHAAYARERYRIRRGLAADEP